MKWLQVIGYPGYFVNSNLEVIGKKGGILNGPVVTLRRKDREQLSITRKRLFLLTLEGLDPYLVRYSEVDTVEIEGGLRLVDFRERRRNSAIKQHAGLILSAEDSKRLFERTKSWADACIKAIDGDTSSLWVVLCESSGELNNYLLSQCGEHSKAVREEIVQETLTLYVERVLQGKTLICNSRGLKRMARGLLAIFRKQDLPLNTNQSI